MNGIPVPLPITLDTLRDAMRWSPDMAEEVWMRLRRDAEAAGLTLAPTPPDALDDAKMRRLPAAGADPLYPLTRAPTPPDALDVERLARAMRTVMWDEYRDDPTLASVDAAAIAREYAAPKDLA